MLRWSAADMFAMKDLRNQLVQIEKRALGRRPVILTRHGRPTFAFVRLDALEGLASAGSAPKLTASERTLYDRVFARAERDLEKGDVLSLEEVERRVDKLFARREKAKSTGRSRSRQQLKPRKR